MKIIKYTITLIALSATLYSCGVYTSYSRPEKISTDSLFRSDIAQSALATVDTTENIATLPWRELFTDTLLQSYIQTGLEQNTDLRVAQLRVEQAEASLSAAKLSYLPSLSINPQAGVSKAEGQRRLLTHSETLSASWELDFFGKIRNSNAQVRAQMEQSVEYRQAVQSRLIASIAVNYYSLVMLHKQLQVTEETLGNWHENVRTLRAMKNAGMTTEAAVSQAEGNYYQVEASVAELKQQITELENTFSSILGNTSQKVVVNDKAVQDFSLPVLSVGLPIELLANRPDVRQAEAGLKYAFYGINAARAAFYPSITLGGNAGWSNNVGNAISNPAQFLVSALGSLVQPLFAQGRLTAQLRISRAQQEEATAVFQQTLLDAGVEINNALSATQTSRIKSESYNKQIASLENAVRSTKLLMQHGSNTYLEVLISQQTLLAARLTQIENEFDEAQNLIILYRALGGGSI